MDLMTLIIQLVSGAVGGNVAGGLFKNINMGTLWNSVAGIVGGGLGGQILGSLFNMPAASGIDPVSILTQVASGGAGGGILLAIVGMIRSMMAK